MEACHCDVGSQKQNKRTCIYCSYWLTDGVDHAWDGFIAVVSASVYVSVFANHCVVPCLCLSSVACCARVVVAVVVSLVWCAVCGCVCVHARHRRAVEVFALFVKTITETFIMLLDRARWCRLVVVSARSRDEGLHWTGDSRGLKRGPRIALTGDFSAIASATDS